MDMPVVARIDDSEIGGTDFRLAFRLATEATKLGGTGIGYANVNGPFGACGLVCRWCSRRGVCGKYWL